jgi:hypothetical protein
MSVESQWEEMFDIVKQTGSPLTPRSPPRSTHYAREETSAETTPLLRSVQSSTPFPVRARSIDSHTVLIDKVNSIDTAKSASSVTSNSPTRCLKSVANTVCFPPRGTVEDDNTGHVIESQEHGSSKADLPPKTVFRPLGERVRAAVEKFERVSSEDLPHSRDSDNQKIPGPCTPVRGKLMRVIH